MADKDNQYNLISPASLTPPAPTFNFASLVPMISLPMLPVRFFMPPPETDDPELIKSYLGTPVYSNVVFTYDTDYGIDGLLGSPDINPKLSSKDLRIDTCILNVQLRKQVVLTVVNGRKDKNGKEVGGTVKEYIAMGDYEINCVGELVGPGRLQYPRNAMAYLNAVFKAPKQVAIVSDFLNTLGIGSIVIMDGSFAEKPGSRNEVLFSFSALSDIDVAVNTQGQ